MAYDEELAERTREVIGAVVPIDERKMFGGIAFMVDRHMAVVVSGQGGLMVRCDPADAPELSKASSVEPAIMRGKEMPGWLRVAADAVATDAALSEWVSRGLAFVATLPAKT